MSAPVATTDAPPPAKGKKKLIIIIAAVAVVLAGGGGAALMMMKKKAAVEAEAEEDVTTKAAPKVAAKHDPKAVPLFVPLEPFTVNLADRDAERFAQVGITLEIDDAKTGDQMKAYMPAIRNNILMALADRTAAELMTREGKGKLTEKIKIETSRALGFEVAEADPEADEEAEKPTKKKKKAKKAAPELPVRAVHFSNFIIQ